MGVISAGIYESHWLDDLIGPFSLFFSLGDHRRHRRWVMITMQSKAT